MDPTNIMTAFSNLFGGVDGMENFAQNPALVAGLGHAAQYMLKNTVDD